MALSGLPRPRPDLDSEAFWEGCKDSRFLVPRCAEHGHTRWPPGPMCPACQSTNTEWSESTGRGKVYSWVVVTHPVDPMLVGQVPYAVAMIELEEGIRVVGNIAGCSPGELVPGMDVEVYFEEPDEQGIRLPNFRKVG